MKKVLLPLLILMAFSMLLAVESAPSAIVGYVKYPCTVGGNFVAISLDSGYTMASSLADANPGMMDLISYWSAADQSWFTASDWGYWDGDFPVENGMPLMVNCINAFNLYSMGSIPTTPNYSLVVGANTLMIPLNQSSFALASDLATSVATAGGGLDLISYWSAVDQSWFTASDWGYWDGDFPVSIGMPLMVNSTSISTWPGERTVPTVRNSKTSK